MDHVGPFEQWNPIMKCFFLLQTERIIIFVVSD